MPRKGKKTAEIIEITEEQRPIRPAKTVEGRENQLISLAVDLAEKQLREGTASAQVITHYLKLGSTEKRLEKQMLEKRIELMQAQKDSLQSAQKMEALYEDAIKAFTSYQPTREDPDE